MKNASNPKRAMDADVAWDGVESGIAIELEILAGVENVEPCNPECYGGGENEDARIERAANGDLGRGRCDTESKSENEVRPTGESLGIGIEKQHSERNRRKPEREPIQLSSSENKNRARDDDKGGDEGGREMSRWQSASTSAGIGGVNRDIGKPVESHSRRAARDHCDYDPKKLMAGGNARGRQHRSA